MPTHCTTSFNVNGLPSIQRQIKIGGVSSIGCARETAAKSILQRTMDAYGVPAFALRPVPC